MSWKLAEGPGRLGFGSGAQGEVRRISEARPRNPEVTKTNPPRSTGTLLKVAANASELAGVVDVGTCMRAKGGTQRGEHRTQGRRKQGKGPGRR